MNSSAKIFLFLTLGILTFFTTSCDTNNQSDLDPPETYEFMRNSESSVAYPGQADRLNMVEEIKAYLSKGNKGDLLFKQALVDMFENTGGDGGGNFSFTSDRKLSNKTFPPDLEDSPNDSLNYYDLFQSAAAASENGNSGIRAQNGVAGLIERENKGSDILVSGKGHEYVQFVEKGLMGSVMIHQIFNVYLTDDRIGSNVENEQLEEGKNYTPKEHHFDEAYGYWDAPRDFTSPWPDAREEELRFWANYSNVVDNVQNNLLGTNEIIQDAYILGRTAIVNKDQQTLNEQRDIIYENLELVAAATAVHYINSTLTELSSNNTGEAFHALSEAWAFVNALKYSPRRKISLDEISKITFTDFGENGNFWKVTTDGLNAAKATLVDVYPDLEPVKDQL